MFSKKTIRDMKKIVHFEKIYKFTADHLSIRQVFFCFDRQELYGK